mmetsp:Transcript_68533/g.79851  ORF Transcript_68533/g.79851 Transcript_68533/m.79851 type:complete len:98 (-) Transcript_68533:566-859(-)
MEEQRMEERELLVVVHKACPSPLTATGLVNQGMRVVAAECSWDATHGGDISLGLCAKSKNVSEVHNKRGMVEESEKIPTIQKQKKKGDDDTVVVFLF